MDSQDEVKSGLEPDDAAITEPVPATMSRGCEMEQETPAAPGKPPHEPMVAEPLIGDTGADPDVSINSPDTSTQRNTLLPSTPGVSTLEPSLSVAPLNAAITQQQHVTYDLTGASSVNIIQGSHLADTQLSLVASPSTDSSKSVRGPIGSGQPVNSPNDLSHLFGEACLNIAKCLDEEDKLDELKLVVQCWSYHDTTSKLIPDAQEAKSVVQLFQRATARHLWHWLDFENLIRLLETISSEKAKEILQGYEKHLLLFCEEELSALVPSMKSSETLTEKEWMDVKWKGEQAKFKLKCLLDCKDFLANHLGINSTAFVFYEMFHGCVTFRWVILTSSACAAIEAKCAEHTQLQFLDAEVEIKLVRPAKTIKQRMTHLSNPENVYVLDECFFGNTEYSFFQRVPEYANCTVCKGVVQNAVVSNCCCKPFCMNCSEAITRAANSTCPHCRHEDFQYSTNEFIDKQVVGNLYAKCSRCGWIGYLSDASSELSHPCILETRASSEVVQEATEHPEHVDDETKEQVSVLSEEPCADGQLQSEFNEKEPLLGMMHALRSNIQSMQMYIDDDRLSSHSGNPSISAAAEAFRSGIDNMTTLLQTYEDTLHVAEHSIASRQDGLPPAAVSESGNPEQEESRSSLVPGTGPSGPAQQAVVPVKVTPPASGKGFQKPGKSDTPLMGPLHLACWHGDYAKFRALVDQGAYINALGMFGMTPLHMAMFQGQADIASDLISLGAHINPRSRIGLSSLYHPGASSEAMSLLLHARASLPQEVQRLVHLAVTAGDTSLVEKLIQATKLHPDHTTYTGQSLLFTACQQGYVRMTEKLLTLGASAFFSSAFGRSPVHGACYSGSLPCLELLLKNHAKVNVHDMSGDTPLHTATRQGHAMVVQELLKHDCELNCADRLKRSPLHFAAQKGNCELVAILHKAGANLNAMDHIGATPVHVAVSFGRTAVVKELLEAGADPNLPLMNDLLTPLHSAARQKDQGKDMIHLLHRAKANVGVRDRKGRGLLYHAVRSGSIEIVQCVVGLGCSVDEAAPAEVSGKVPRSAEHESPHDDFPLTDEDLIMRVSGMHGGDIGPFQLAILLGYVEIVEFLIFKGADVHKVTSTGFTAIHFAVRNGNPHLIRLLVAEGCNPNQMSRDGFAPLHLAAQWGHRDAAVMLIRAGCNKEITTGNKQKPQALTALLIAAMTHQTELLITLIEEGCNVQASTADKSNAIHLAVTGLQIHKSQQEMQNPYLDPFHQFSTDYIGRQRGSVFGETVKIVVKHGCNVNAMNSEGLTPLDLLQSMRKSVHALPHLRFDPRYADVEESYSFMRHTKALTSHELLHRGKLTATLNHVTTGAENIEAKLKTAPRYPLKYAGGQDILSCPPVSNDLTLLIVPRASRMWREIGESLGVSSTLLDLAHTQGKGNARECCMRVFGFWLSGAGKHPIAWNTMLDALEAVGERPLANSVLQQLQKMYGFKS